MPTPAEFEISTVAYRGAGISRSAGKVTFIPRTLPGEVVAAEVVSERKKFRVARLVEVLRPSPDRIDSECLLSDGTPVPGCDYDFARYEAEVSIKEGQLRDFLRAFDIPDSAFLPTFASPSPLHYRNRVTFHVANGAAGFLGEDNRTVVDVPSCPLAHPEINAEWAEVRASIGATPPFSWVALRRTEANGVVVWTDTTPPPPERRLAEYSPIGTLYVPCDGFYQVNPFVSGTLLEQVRDWIAAIVRDNPIDLALDLYCGVGPFALAAAKAGVPRVVGVEASKPSVKCARSNAKRHSIAGAEFHCRDVAHFLADEEIPPQLENAIAVADPPRTGIPRRALDRLCASPLRHAVFVSCNPSTLARDLAVAMAAGFAVRAIRLFDMFPRTIHFETAVLLERQ